MRLPPFGAIFAAAIDYPWRANEFWQQAAAWPSFSWQDFAARSRRIASDEARLRRKFWRKLKREAASIPFLEDVLTAHYCAFDRKTPLYVKVVLVGAMSISLCRTISFPIRFR